MKSSKVLLGIAAAAAAGAIVGILFAPDKGSNTRKKIANRTTDMTDAVKNSFSDFIDGLKNAYSGAKEDVEEMSDKVKAKMATSANSAKQAVS